MAGEASEAVARRARTPPGDTWIPGDCTHPGSVLGDAPADVVDALLFMALMLSSRALLAEPVLPPSERGLPGQGRPLPTHATLMREPEPTSPPPPDDVRRERVVKVVGR